MARSGYSSRYEPVSTSPRRVAASGTTGGSPGMKRVHQAPAVSAMVTSQLRAAILDGTLAPGSRVTQEWLAQRLDVSRVPIRLALARLEREGLVQHRRGTGLIVTPLDLDLIRDLYEFREAVDGYVAASLAACRALNVPRLRAIVDEGRTAVDAGDAARLIELDRRFHAGLYSAVHNHLIISAMHDHWAHIQRIVSSTVRRTGYRPEIWDEHAAMLDAIARGHADDAEREAIAHTRASRAWLLASFRTGRSA